MKDLDVTWKRYFSNDGNSPAKLDPPAMSAQLHAAYTHWVGNNCHIRDFVAAVEHVAQFATAAWLIDGSPRLNGQMPQLQAVALCNASLNKPQQGAALRFYDEHNEINPGVDLSLIERVIHHAFVNWVGDAWHPRDFRGFATDCADVLVYDHMLCRSLAGLGGGRTEQEFLTQAYRG